MNTNNHAPKGKRIKIWNADDVIEQWGDPAHTSAVEAEIFDPRWFVKKRHDDSDLDQELEDVWEGLARDQEEQSDWEEGIRNFGFGKLGHIAGIVLVITIFIYSQPDSSTSESSSTYTASVVSIPDLTDTPSEVYRKEYPSLSWMAPSVRERFATSEDGRQIRCLAQVLASESNDEYAMTKIAWVVRNRVEAESEIFGEGYCGVAYRTRQFSGLNTGSHQSKARYELNTSRDYDMVHASVVEQENWENAIVRANAVYYADRDLATLPWDVFYFYSPVSMTGNGYATWARGCKAYELVRDLDEQKGGEYHFAFYRGTTCKTLRTYLEDIDVLPQSR